MQWLMLQQKEPEDFVIATGEQHSVREFIELAAAELDMDFSWQGEGIQEVGIIKTHSMQLKTIVRIDPRYFRPTEVESLLGDPTKAKEKLNWNAKISFEELVKEMVGVDFNKAKNEKNKLNS